MVEWIEGLTLPVELCVYLNRFLHLKHDIVKEDSA